MSKILSQSWLSKAAEDLTVACLILPDCIIIDQYYIPTRYPDAVPGGLPGGLPGKSEAEEAVGIAEKIVDFVVLRL